MSDVFISYASEDRPRAQMLAEALEGRGWRTFWDRTIPIGKTWRETIGRELGGSRCVIVLWSKSSIESGWVQEEADDAKRRGVLVPVLIDDVQPPIGFRSIQAADLADWDATRPSQAFSRLVADIAALIQPSSPAAGEGKRAREQPTNVEEERLAEEQRKSAEEAHLAEERRKSAEQARLDEARRRNAEQARLDEARSQPPPMPTEQPRPPAAGNAVPWRIIAGSAVILLVIVVVAVWWPGTSVPPQPVIPTPTQIPAQKPPPAALPDVTQVPTGKTPPAALPEPVQAPTGKTLLSAFPDTPPAASPAVKVIAAPPPDYFVQASLGRKPDTRLNLVMQSTKRNEITDEEEWWKRNRLDRPVLDPVPSIVPYQFQGKTVGRAIIGNPILALYGQGGQYLLAIDPLTGATRFAMDFAAFQMPHDYVPADRDYIKMETTWAALDGDVLFVSHSHSTYAASSKGYNAYISAIDVNTGQLLWHSKPLVSNSQNFLLKGDAILTGYGFSDEKDYLYILNKSDGRVVRQMPIRKSIDWLIEHDGKLFVRTYDTDFVFTYAGE